jgi:flagellar biogenesis protein FliO
VKIENEKSRMDSDGSMRPFSVFYLSIFLAILVGVCLPVFAAAAATSRPENATPLEQRPLVRGQVGQKTDAVAPTAPTDGIGFTRVLLSLVAVVGLILFLRWWGAKLFKGQGTPHSGGVMQVIARAPIAPRQQLMMVRVGRRVVVVSNSAGQMTTLSEITDADEVAELLGQLKRGREPGANPFAAIFSRAEADYEEPAGDGAESGASPAAVDAQSPADVRTELNGLMEKVRGMARQFR